MSVQEQLPVADLNPKTVLDAHEHKGRLAGRVARQVGETALAPLKQRAEPEHDHRRTPVAPELAAEINNPIVMRGEATGMRRKVWYLGRRFTDEKTPLIATPPLGVKFDGYLREHLSNVVAATERPAVVVGNVGFNGRGDYAEREAEDKSHFSYAATDIHSILDQVAAGRKTHSEWGRIDLDEYIYTGASQGAMMGLELLAQNQLFGRLMTKGVLVAPAGLRNGHFNDAAGIRVTFEAAKQYLLHEPIETARYFLRAAAAEKLRVVLRLSPTFPPHPAALLPACRSAKAILGGGMIGIDKAIQTAVAQQSGRTELAILSFDKDKTGTPGQWREQLGYHPNLKVSEHVVPGHHITGIIRPETEIFVIDSLLEI